VLEFEQTSDKNYFMDCFLAKKSFKVAKTNDLKIEYSHNCAGPENLILVLTSIV